MNRHTPGPWIAEQQREEMITTAIGEPIAVVGGNATGEDIEFVVGRPCDYGPHGNEQTRCNAILIAAAPAMYESLLEAGAFIDDMAQQIICPPNTQLHKLARKLVAVIARAEGRTV